jgi:ribose transport system substrate-binding protein
VIPKGTSHEFWKAIHAGAVKAQRELEGQGVKVEVIWKGPAQEDDIKSQIQVVNDFVAQHVHGIVLAPCAKNELAGPVEAAVKAKVPVVIMDSSLNSRAQVSLVATDNREGGRIAARNLGKLIGGKGNVIMLRYLQGSASTEARELGFLETMKTDFPAIKLVSVDQRSGATPDSTLQVSEALLKQFGAELSGVFASNEAAAGGMLRALRAAGLAGKVKFVAFDSSEALNAGLKKGDVQGLVVQSPMKMGYLSVKTLVNALRGQTVEPFVDTGVAFVTKENFDSPAVAESLNPPLDLYLK